MNYTVIVAEDEELLLNNLVHKIEKADPDFQVIGTAQTGAQALSLVEQMSPDVGIYGYQNARHGRYHPAHQDSGSVSLYEISDHQRIF